MMHDDAYHSFILFSLLLVRRGVCRRTGGKNRILTYILLIQYICTQHNRGFDTYHVIENCS